MGLAVLRDVVDTVGSSLLPASRVSAAGFSSFLTELALVVGCSSGVIGIKKNLTILTDNGENH